MNKELEDKLNKELYNFFKVKNEKAIKIQRAFKRYKIKLNLSRLAKRIRVFRKVIARSILKSIAKKYFTKC